MNLIALARQDMAQIKLSQKDIAYLDDLFDGFDELPDSDWQAACEEAIGEDPRFKDKDPYEVFVAWSAATSSDRGG